MWRLNRADMEDCGFLLADEEGPADPADPDASHINILEFERDGCKIPKSSLSPPA
jgi:hypothetical protein